MRKRSEIHIGSRQRRHLAHEAERRRKRKVLARIEQLRDTLIPSPRMRAKAAARQTMLEAIAEERKAEAELRARLASAGLLRMAVVMAAADRRKGLAAVGAVS